MESHAADETTGNPRPTRVPAPEDLSPEEKFSNVEGKEDWGSGEDGYMAPADPADRLRFVLFLVQKVASCSHRLNYYRKNLPYKVCCSFHPLCSTLSSLIRSECSTNFAGAGATSEGPTTTRHVLYIEYVLHNGYRWKSIYTSSQLSMTTSVTPSSLGPFLKRGHFMLYPRFLWGYLVTSGECKCMGDFRMVILRRTLLVEMVNIAENIEHVFVHLCSKCTTLS